MNIHLISITTILLFTLVSQNINAQGYTRLYKISQNEDKSYHCQYELTPRETQRFQNIFDLYEIDYIKSEGNLYILSSILNDTTQLLDFSSRVASKNWYVVDSVSYDLIRIKDSVLYLYHDKYVLDFRDEYKNQRLKNRKPKAKPKHRAYLQPIDSFVVKNNTFIWDSSLVHIYPDSFPQLKYKGGIKQFIKDSLSYPIWRAFDVPSLCFVIVSDEGKLLHTSLLQGFSNLEENKKISIACIRKMKNWKPAYYQGKAVHSIRMIPVRLN